MNMYTWIGLSIQAVPVFFIIRNTITVIKNKSLN
jgi:hypothetical protein